MQDISESNSKDIDPFLKFSQNSVQASASSSSQLDPIELLSQIKPISSSSQKDYTPPSSQNETNSSSSQEDTTAPSSQNETNSSSSQENTSIDRDKNGVFKRSKAAISIEEAIKILLKFNPASDKYTDSIEKPKGGEMLFFYSNDPIKAGKYFLKNKVELKKNENN
jgi:hypothetical protein